MIGLAFLFNTMGSFLDMPDVESNNFSTLPSWILAIITGLALSYFYILITSHFDVNSGFLISQFPDVTKEEALILLYLGYFIMGIPGTILSAFLVVFVPSFFFRQSPMRFGFVVGMVAILFLIWIFVFYEGGYPEVWGKRPWFLVIDFLHWMMLIGCCGLVSLLGHKTREKFLALYREASLK
jgi:hypothetical protein